MQHLIRATVMIAALTDWKVTQLTNERQHKPNLSLQRKQKDREQMCLVQIRSNSHSAFPRLAFPSLKGLRVEPNRLGII